jgi:Ser/Thr protein kinase RdoA (MazF antagonist)
LFKKINFTKSIIHEDLSMENIILSKSNSISFIDFGESHKSEIISDIAITIKEIIISNKGVDFNLIRAYLHSYQKIIRLNKNEIMALPFLLKRRTVFMIAYLLNKQEINKTTELKKKIGKEIKILKTLQKKDCLIRNFIKEYVYE